MCMGCGRRTATRKGEWGCICKVFGVYQLFMSLADLVYVIDDYSVDRYLNKLLKSKDVLK